MVGNGLRCGWREGGKWTERLITTVMMAVPVSWWTEKGREGQCQSLGKSAVDNNSALLHPESQQSALTNFSAS